MISWCINFMKIQTFKYLFFGFLTTIVSFIIYNAYIFYGVNLIISNTWSFIGAVIFAYITNKIWVFDSKSFSLKIVVREFSIFVLSRVLVFLLETVCLVLLVDMLAVNEIIAKIITSVGVVIINYVISKFAVFRS